MIYKPNQIFAGITDGVPHVFSLDMYEYPMLKAAANDLHPEIEAYIRNAKPIPGKNILLIDALGAGEIWGANVNGDYYGRQELMNEEDDAGYRSFMYHAYPYKHHQNEARKKDPSRRFGEKVVLSVYHKPMDRVQLIAIVDSSPDRAGDIVEQIDSGSFPDVSMACTVAYDQCSICGSRHRTRGDYCEHAKHNLNKIMDNGQKVFLKNYRLKFHDISFVLIGADRSAKVLKKIASPYDLTQYYAHGGRPKIIDKKQSKAEIRKSLILEDPIVTKIAIDKISSIQDREPMLSKEILSRLSQYDLGDVTKTASMLGVSFRPEEFQYLLVSHEGNPELAEKLASEGTVFDISTYDNPDFHSLNDGQFSDIVGSILSDVLEARSGHAPFLQKRASFKIPKIFGDAIKPASTNLVWPAVAGAFVAYKKKVPADLVSLISKGASEISPFIKPAAYAYLVHKSMKIGHDLAEQSYEPWDPEEALWEPEEIGKVSSALPMMLGFSSIPIIYMLSSHLKDLKDQNPVAYDSKVTPLGKILTNYPDVAAMTSLLAIPALGKALSFDRKFVKEL